MNFNNFKATSILIPFACFIFVFILFHTSLNADQRKIGVVLPLTGGASSNGESVRNSVLLADEAFDTKGQIEFIFEDDQLLPKSTVSAVNKLIAVDSVDGLIVFGSGTSLAVNGIAEAAKVPMIGMSIVDRVVKDKQYVVKHWVTAENESDLINSEIEKHNYKTIAVVTTANDAMLKLRDLFLKNNSHRVVLNEEFIPTELNFQTVTAKINTINPEAVYVLLWAPQTGLFSKKLRERGYGKVIFGVHNIEDPNEIAVAAGALDKAWYVTGDDSRGESYYQDYKNRYGKLPATGGINGYDAAKIMIEGNKSGNLNLYLHTVKDFEGAYGKYGATGSNDFSIPAKVKVVNGNI